MPYHIIPASARTVSRWAGGTTEQLFIWPEGADYTRRDFALRVSTAAVELDESGFTPLADFTRWIMPLSGVLTLEHEGHGGASLAPLITHRFEGGWSTRSKGRCVDFNLMLAAGWDGIITGEPGAHRCEAGALAGVYAFAGPVMVAVGGETIHLAARDVLILRGPGALALPEGQRAVAFVARPVGAGDS